MGLVAPGRAWGPQWLVSQRKGIFQDNAASLACMAGDEERCLPLINSDLQHEGHCRITAHMDVSAGTSMHGHCRTRTTQGGWWLPLSHCGVPCPTVSPWSAPQVWARTCGTSCYGVGGLLGHLGESAPSVSLGTSDLPGAGFLGRPLDPSKEEQTQQQSTTWGKKGLFCPFLVLAPSSTVALPPTQSCPSPPEPCLDPNDVPTATTSSQLPPAAAANPRCPCLGRALPPSPALGTVSAGPLPAPRALSKHISQLEDKNIPFLTPRAIDFACSCGGGEGGRTRGRER